MSGPAVEHEAAPYLSLEKAEFFVIVSRGAFAFRFGPFEGRKAGAILQQCQDEKIPALITANCGAEFDWDLARDLHPVGNPSVTSFGLAHQLITTAEQTLKWSLSAKNIGPSSDVTHIANVQIAAALETLATLLHPEGEKVLPELRPAEDGECSKP